MNKKNSKVYSFQLNAAIFYPYALAFGAEALVSIKRIEEFLMKNEKSESDDGLERRDSLVIVDAKRESNEQNFYKKISNETNFNTQMMLWILAA